MPSIYETMIGAPPSGPEETARAAKSLRGNSELGMLAMITGDPMLSQVGSGMMERSVNREEGLQQMRQKQMIEKRERDKRASEIARWDQQDAMNKAELEERIRHNKASEQEALRKAMSSGSDKAIPPVTAQKTSREVIKASSVVDSIATSFKDEYGSKIGLGEGTLTNMYGKAPWGSDEAKEQAHWWSEYRRLRELTERNRMFGSALTAPEQKAWKSANINENSSADIIKKSLASMQKVAAADRDLQENSDRALYNTEWVDAIYTPAYSTDKTAELIYETQDNQAQNPAQGPTSTQGFSYTVSP